MSAHQPGMIVKIEGTRQPNGSILADEIKPGLGEGDDKDNGDDKGDALRISERISYVRPAWALT